MGVFVLLYIDNFNEPKINKTKNLNAEKQLFLGSHLTATNRTTRN